MRPSRSSSATKRSRPTLLGALALRRTLRGSHALRRTLLGTLAMLGSLALAACHAPHVTPVPVAASCRADGVVVLAGQDDVAGFASCSTATAVTIRTGARLDTASLQLATISGDLVIGPSVGTETIVLGQLRSVGGRIRVSGNQSLRNLSLPRLETAGAIELDGNTALATIAMPVLASAAAIAITDDAELELVDLPALVTIGGTLVITDAPKLALLELAQLASVGAVRIEHVDALPADVAEALRRLPAR